MISHGVILYADDHVFDHKTQEGKLYKLLRKNFPVMAVDSVEMAEKAVSSIGTFSALILDWEFKIKVDEGARRPPQTPEPFLDNHDFYSLIYIFSRKGLSTTLKKKYTRKFPGRVKYRIKSINKVGQDYKDIKSDLESWKRKNKRSVIAMDWSGTINLSVQKIFSELTRADVNWIHDLYRSADSDVSPEIEVVNLLQCILSEQLITNKELLQSISQLKKDKSESKSDRASAVAKLARRLYYTRLDKFSLEEVPIMTGDVFSLNNAKTKYGIIITPECDIRHIKGNDNQFFELLTFERKAAHKIMRENVRPNVEAIDRPSFFNYLNELLGRSLTNRQKRQIRGILNDQDEDQFERLIEFLNPIMIQALTRGHEISIGKRLKEHENYQIGNLYKQALNQDHKRLHLLPSFYFTFRYVNELAVVDFRNTVLQKSGSELENCNRICKINSPFIQELRQRYLAYIGRVGVPAPVDSLKELNIKPLIS